MLPDESTTWAKLLGVDADADAQTVCRAFEKLAVAIAPHDLGKWPIYCVPRSALPYTFCATSESYAGWFDSTAYFAVRNYLPRDRGVGPVLLAVDEYSQQDAQVWARAAQQVCAVGGEDVSLDEFLECVPSLFNTARLCRILLHELGHAIESVASGAFAERIEAIHSGRASTAAVVQSFEVAATRKWNEPGEIEHVYSQGELASHPLSFIRTLCHLDHRLRRAGVHATQLTPRGNYNFPPYEECFDALNGEFVQYRKSSFREINSSRPPAEFMVLGLGNNEPAVA